LSEVDEAGRSAGPPLIVTALFGDADFARFDALRRAHFPPERNVLRAHLTMFHHLPPSVEGELAAFLKQATREAAPAARVAGLRNMGRGVAFRIESAGLEALRAEIADRFRMLLTPQDKAGWRPHVTIQNKVAPNEAKALLVELEAVFVPHPLDIAGLAIWRYVGGPWEPVGAWRFGNGHSMRAPC